MSSTPSPVSTRPADLAVACATSLISHQALLRTALREAAAAPASAGEGAAPYRWEAVRLQLDMVIGDTMRSISALYNAAAESRPAIEPDSARRTAQRALAFLNGVVQLHQPLSEAVQICGVKGSSASGTWPIEWASMFFNLDEMHSQALAALESVSISARHEQAIVAAKEHVYSEGDQEFEVLVTLEATAHRFMHVRADDLTAAQELALTVARSENGAHFTLNEGNFVTASDVHVTSVYDAVGNEVWNDSEGELAMPADAPS